MTHGEIYRGAVRSMWEAGAKAAGRDPRMELRAFDSGWDAALDAVVKYPDLLKSKRKRKSAKGEA